MDLTPATPVILSFFRGMPARRDDSNHAIIRSLADRYSASLRAALGNARRVALLDFPNYYNVGDSLIWLGQLTALRQLGVEVAYVATAESYSLRHLRRKLPHDAPLLFSGGGNLGDLYPRIQRFRERVLEEAEGHPFIQLPQTIHFRAQKAADVFFTRVRSRARTTIMVRDRESEALAHTHGVEALLCPDGAFCLGPLHAKPATQSHVLLLRTDSEKSAQRLSLPDGNDGAATDWIRPRGRDAVSFLYDITFIAQSRRSFPLIRPFLPSIFFFLPWARLRKGIDVVARGDLLVTDRLHGHVLAMLLGIPQILLDNNYGKLSRFHRDWTSGASNVFIPTERESFDAVYRRARREAGLTG